MADHYVYCDQTCQNSRKINRVYINPNFNRSDIIPTHGSNMHFNPNFSHDLPNLYNHHGIHTHPANKARIHVNPNFIKNANVIKPTESSPKQSISIQSCQKQEAKNQSQTSSMHITKSRYCLVRQKENLIAKSPNLKPVTTTVRVNKYKSVSINVVKNNLATRKPANSTINVSLSQKEKYKISCKPIIAPTNNTRFKLVNFNTASVLNQSHTKQVGVRRHSLLNKNTPKTASRKLNNKLVLKKINIPCPLFKKYGNCLRKIKGNCEYLHDKKQVSICRTFLKGICHNENCLLSHDLTDKKMPTCYFYLQGACMKENCPYLHVKLNEKTKICHDFLRGYCDKGDRCLFRHINVCRDITLKKVSSKKQSTYSSASKINSVMNLRSRMKWLIKRQEQNAQKNDYPVEEHRYFKESVEDKSSNVKCDNNMIKPSRVKLGTLPSFIQL